MIQPTSHQSLRITKTKNTELKNQEIVKVKIIKQLTKQKWALSIKGKIFPAVSDIDFQIGEERFAKVYQKANHYLLKIQNQNDNLINHIIKQLDLPKNPLIPEIISALMTEEMKISLENIIFLLKALDKLEKKDLKSLKLLIIILKKGINPNFTQLSDLINLLNWGEKDHHDQNKRQKDNKQKYKDLKNQKQNLKNKIKECMKHNKSETINLLSLFNSLKEEKSSWIFVPYEFSMNNINIRGSFRFLWNNYKKNFDKCLIIIYIQNREVQVEIKPYNTGLKLLFSCKDNELYKRLCKRLEVFQNQLKHLNVHVSSKMSDDNLFSALSEPSKNMKYKPVNWIT